MCRRWREPRWIIDMQAMLRVALESPERADVVELIGELDRYLSALYARSTTTCSTSNH
jgi:hypothetical protein